MGRLDDEPTRTGERVLRFRLQVGLTQRELAAQVGRSRAWVGMVETGAQPVASLSVLRRLADALGVRVSDLAPDEIAFEPEAEDPATLEILSQMAARPEIPAIYGSGAKAAASSLGPAEVAACLDRLAEAATEHDHRAVIEELAPLLPVVETALAKAANRQEERAWARLRARVYELVSVALHHRGQRFTSWVTADRAVSEALRTNDRVFAWPILLRTVYRNMYDQPRAVRLLAGSMLDALTATAPASDAERCLLGETHLALALLRARDRGRRRAEDHLRRARDLAHQVRSATPCLQEPFDETAVQLVALRSSVELGDAGAALDTADDIDQRRLTAGQRVRWLLDSARAQLLANRPKRACDLLVEATSTDLGRRYLRDNADARALITQLLERSGPRGETSQTLQRLRHQLAR